MAEPIVAATRGRTTSGPGSRRLRLDLPRAAAAFTIVMGGLVLAGHVFDLDLLASSAPGLGVMRPGSAVCFVGAGLALWCVRVADGAGPRAALARRGSVLGAGTAILVAATTLAQDAFGERGASNETPPGPMPIALSASFLLAGTAVLLLAAGRGRGTAAAQWLGAVVATIAVIALLGFMYGAEALHQVRPFASIALHSALALLVLAVGLLAVRPGDGWIREFGRSTAAATMGRRLVLVALMVLPVLGWARLQGQRQGLYGTEFGLAFMLAAAMILLTLLAWATTRAANDAEGRTLQLAKVHAMISGINAHVLRARSRTELFGESCRIAVQAGRYPLVWIGVIERESGRVIPIAWSVAEEKFLGLVLARLSRTEGEAPPEGLAAQALREGRTIISNDVTQESALALQREYLRLGIHSVAFLPLGHGQAAAGLLALHAEEPGAFDEAETKLLAELAGHIGFALGQLDRDERLDFLAYHDALTGLANPQLFMERLAVHLDLARRDQGGFALAVMDIERFQTINDTLGRGAGDELLKQVAARLTRRGEELGRVARLGPNEFAVILPAVATPLAAARRHEARVKECFEPPFHVERAELRVRVKSGIAMYPDDADDPATLVQSAESALKRAKAAGEPSVFYTQDLSNRIAERLDLENALRGAVERQAFVLHFQPKVDARTWAVTGLEALIRWPLDGQGLVPPARFIPILEETGLIVDVGDWVLRQGALQHRQWSEERVGEARIAVNVSPVQLRQPDFVDRVRRALELGSPGPGLDLEITESVIMSDIEDNIAKLEEVRDLGVNVAIDDFGTGYSSLAYLARLPVQSLKIDRSFVVSMLMDRATMTLVTTMVSLAHSLGMKVVAEGVETREQAGALEAVGCDEIQGYVVGKPMPAADMRAFLRRGLGRETSV